MEKYLLFPAIYALVVGIGMIGQWIFFYLKGQIPELTSEPIRIGFHLAAETMTAFLLIISGIAILLGWGLAAWLFPLSMGMLFYTAIVSPGYFAQKGQWGFVWMFVGVILLAWISLMVLIGVGSI